MQKSKIKNQNYKSRLKVVPILSGYQIFSPCFFNFKLNNGGYAALTTTILALVVSITVVGGFTLFTLREVNINRVFTKSIESRSISESGIEDGVYRVVTQKQVGLSETLAVGKGTTTITLTTAGNNKIVRSEGKRDNFQQNLESRIDIITTGVSFNYGVQVGDLGLVMGNGSTIVGNIYSNGDINGGGKTNTTITGTAISAGSHIIKDLSVNGSAYADRFDNCSIGGIAHFITSFSANCTASSTVQDASPQPAGTFPISQAQIDTWKNEAAAGGTLNGVSAGNNQSITLGPKKINGNIDMGNNSTITLTGTVWVTGTINLGNSATIELDPAVYGSLSGLILMDGVVDFGNTSILRGSGQAGSYLMVLSTFGPGDAIDLGNSASGALFYAPNGIIDMGNGLSLREATGRGMRTGNNTTITYEVGLANVQFTSGPSGGYEVKHWKEVE